jgi:branched-chain amino acid aminotransferase
VNEAGNITEGSRSNVFFVAGNKVFTSPDECVLKGITRDYVIQVIEKEGMQVDKTLVNTADLGHIEGVFITGTSIKALPVSMIDNITYSSSTHPKIVKIRDEFDMFINEYISGKIK